MNRVIVSGISLVALAITACSPEAPAAPAATAAALPNGLFLTQAPDNPRTLVASKETAKVGDEVVFTARIGGRRDPFVKSSAVFIVVDPKLLPCNELHGDGCVTPWDYCCETPADLLAHSATIRIVDDHDAPLAVGLQGTHGLDPLRTVTVRGKVAQRDDAGTLFVVDAAGIYVQP
ncbi:MAG: hypothetical protein AB7O52_09015 [Planctomycetota bacterium]